jgi:hypothetical protein
VISLLANLDARTQSSPVMQDDTSSPQITLGSSPQKHSVNSTPSSLPATPLEIFIPANGYPNAPFSAIRVWKTLWSKLVQTPFSFDLLHLFQSTGSFGCVNKFLYSVFCFHSDFRFCWKFCSNNPFIYLISVFDLFMSSLGLELMLSADLFSSEA